MDCSSTVTSLLYCSGSMKLSVLSLCCMAVIAIASAEIDSEKEPENILYKALDQVVRAERADISGATNAGL